MLTYCVLHFLLKVKLLLLGFGRLLLVVHLVVHHAGATVHTAAVHASSVHATTVAHAHAAIHFPKGLIYKLT